MFLICTAIPLGETRPISIVTSPTPRTKGLCKVTVTTPGNDVMDLPVKESSDGFTVKFTPTDAGTHVVEVTYNSKPVSTSPFSVNVEPKKQMPEIEVMGLEKRMYCFINASNTCFSKYSLLYSQVSKCP